MNDMFGKELLTAVHNVGLFTPEFGNLVRKLFPADENLQGIILNNEWNMLQRLESAYRSMEQTMGNPQAIREMIEGSAEGSLLRMSYVAEAAKILHSRLLETEMEAPIS